MESKNELSLPERIVAVQKQMKIAIQNHQLILQRKQLLENRIKDDDKFKPHLEIIQFIIVNLGKTQASLLNQYRNELAASHNLKANDNMITHLMKVNLVFNDAPKNIPIYKTYLKKKIFKPEMKSILKMKGKDSLDKMPPKTETGAGDPGKAKSLIIKKSAEEQTSTEAKKQQATLKPKVDESRLEKEREEGNQSPVSVASSSSVMSCFSPSSSESATDEIDLTYSPPPSFKYSNKYQSQLLPKSYNKSKHIIDQQSSKKVTPEDWKVGLDWVPFPSPSVSQSAAKMQQFDQNPLSIEELDQEVYLGMFRLVSKEKFELLKRKRCERKRRSVAGQNSQYSDYLQPLPKRSYGPRRSAPQPPPAVQQPSPAPASQARHPTAAQCSAVIVESAAQDDDDEDKEKPVCTVCLEGGERGPLESCYGCNETFHPGCLGTPGGGGGEAETCPSPNCMAQRKISNIVGANVSSGNASDLELVKRYSSEENTLDGKGEVKETELNPNEEK